jgi:hypothetical protein
MRESRCAYQLDLPVAVLSESPKRDRARRPPLPLPTATDHGERRRWTTSRQPAGRCRCADEHSQVERMVRVSLGRATWSASVDLRHRALRYDEWCFGIDGNVSRIPVLSHGRGAAGRASALQSYRQRYAWYGLEDLSTATGSASRIAQMRWGHEAGKRRDRASDTTDAGPANHRARHLRYSSWAARVHATACSRDSLGSANTQHICNRHRCGRTSHERATRQAMGTNEDSSHPSAGQGEVSAKTNDVAHPRPLPRSQPSETSRWIRGVRGPSRRDGGIERS